MPVDLRRCFRDLPRTLRLFCAGSVLLTLVGLTTRAICAHLLHLSGYPYGYYVLTHDGDGVDLMNYYVRFQHFHTLDVFSPAYGSVYIYPAAVAPLYWLFYRVRHAQIPFLLGAVGVMTVLIVWFVRSLRKHGLAAGPAWLFAGIAALCSYPFYFEFTRANMEFWVWLCCAAAVYALVRGRSWLGAALLGVAIAMKIFPFVLLGLLIARRQYRQTALSLLVAAAVNYTSLWLLCPDIRLASQGVNDALKQFQIHFIVPYLPVYIGVDHSLYALLKRLLGQLPPATYLRIFPAYLAVCALAGLLLYFLRIRKLPFVNQVLLLTAASILLPPVSDDYTLIHLYTPFALLTFVAVERWREGQRQLPGETGIWLCLTVLLSQVGEVIYYGDRLGGQIKAVALVILFVLALRYPVASFFDVPPAGDERLAEPRHSAVET